NLSTDLLWRHVAHCAQHYARLGFHRHRRRPAIHHRVALDELREAKIENLDSSVFCCEKILGFQVTVHDSFFMCCRQSASDLLTVVDRFANGKWTAPELRAQGTAFQ